MNIWNISILKNWNWTKRFDCFWNNFHCRVRLKSVNVYWFTSHDDIWTVILAHSIHKVNIRTLVGKVKMFWRFNNLPFRRGAHSHMRNNAVEHRSSWPKYRSKNDMLRIYWKFGRAKRRWKFFEGHFKIFVSSDQRASIGMGTVSCSTFFVITSEQYLSQFSMIFQRR